MLIDDLVATLMFADASEIASEARRVINDSEEKPRMMITEYHSFCPEVDHYNVVCVVIGEGDEMRVCYQGEERYFYRE